MKITKEFKPCPDCKSDSLVISMKSGNVHVFGCLKCRNAPGLFKNSSSAKKAWIVYCDSKEKK